MVLNEIKKADSIDAFTLYDKVNQAARSAASVNADFDFVFWAKCTLPDLLHALREREFTAMRGHRIVLTERGEDFLNLVRSDFESIFGVGA